MASVSLAIAAVWEGRSRDSDRASVVQAPRRRRPRHGAARPPAMRRRSPRGDRRETELLDSIADLIAVQSEERAGFGLVAAASLERLDHQAALELFEIDARRRQPEYVGCAHRGRG